MKTYTHPAAALFTIVKTWRQPKCPSTEESMWYTCTQNTTQFIKNEINATCSDMGRGGRDDHRKGNQGKKQGITSLRNLKTNDTDKLIYKTEIDLQI